MFSFDSLPERLIPSDTRNSAKMMIIFSASPLIAIVLQTNFMGEVASNSSNLHFHLLGSEIFGGLIPSGLAQGVNLRSPSSVLFDLEPGQKANRRSLEERLLRHVALRYIRSCQKEKKRKSIIRKNKTANGL